MGVRVAEPDATAVFSVDNGDYVLKFQSKRNGAALALEVGKDDGRSQKLELVNEKEVRAAKLPASIEELLDIIVCPAGQRDIAAQKYYRILRTTADRELEKKKKEVEGLLAQKEKDYQKISDLFAQVDRMQAALDSAKIREQAFNIASINLDRASQIVKDAMKKIEEENDVEGALIILSTEALDTAYQQASTLKKKAEIAIGQVVVGYEFKISLLEPQFKYGEIAECYEKIAGIYDKEGFEKENLATYILDASRFWGFNGEYKKQLELSLKAFTIYDQALPTNHPTWALIYSHLAGAYGNFGEYQKELEYDLKALAILENILPENHNDLTRYYGSLASTYGHLGQHEKQLESNLKALAIREKNLPYNHPDLARSYGNLAFTFGELGNYKMQLDYNLKAFEIYEKILPTDHPDLAISYNNLASTYGKLGERQKQLEFNFKALGIREKILPPNHPYLGESYNNLAVTYFHLGEYQKQLEFNLKSVAIREKVLPADHPHLAISYGNLAGAYRENGKSQKVLEFYLKSLAITEKSLPANHPDLAWSYSNLANTYGGLGDYQKQLEFYIKALSIREKILPPNHPDLPKSYSNVGRAYRYVGEYAKSIDCIQKAIKLGELANPTHPDLNRFYSNLGITYTKNHQYFEAKDVLIKSERLKGDEGIYRSWVIFYALQKKKKQSIESLQKAISLGFKDLKWLETEPDLKNIRKEKGYKDIVEQLKKQ